MGQKFNINSVIERYSLNPDDVAKALFPHVRYQKLALDRVLKGEATLDVNQLESLANLAGVFVHDLFFIADDWKGTSEDNCLIFLKGDYKVKLNYNGVFMTIYKGPEIIHQELTLKCMSIQEFIDYINKVINN